MRTFLCLSCGEIYEETVENKEYVLGNSYGSNMYPCPKINCCGFVIEVDEFLVSTIRNLNFLGLNTLACCSGHSQDDSVKYSKDVRTYIMFDRHLDIDSYLENKDLELISDSLPDGFILETDNYEDKDRFIISKTSSCKTESGSMLQIASHCADLLSWSENVLPQIMNQIIEVLDNAFVLENSEKSEFIGELDSEDSDSPYSIVSEEC
jgi:hypothetical protein